MNTKITIPKNIQLTGAQIDGDLASCTGSQLIKILELLKNYCLSFDWYVADISANHSLSGIFSIAYNDIPLKVGTTNQFIQFTKEVDQFLSGIFLGVPNSVSNPVWFRNFNTEDESTNNLEPALIEIRAFDTTYFEIYTSESNLIQILHDRFSE